MTDKPERIRRRRDRPKREPEEKLRDLQRFVRKAGTWVQDPDQLVLLRNGLHQALAEAEAQAVAQLRANGYSDAKIGAPLGVTRWAVMRRWPRPGRGKRAAA